MQLKKLVQMLSVSKILLNQLKQATWILMLLLLLLMRCVLLVP